VAARNYNQNCPIAKGLDVLGERWTLLILRELVGGARRIASINGRRSLAFDWDLDEQ
jgi:DNA-binding HxlR family transcriptional regulator